MAKQWICFQICYSIWKIHWVLLYAITDNVLSIGSWVQIHPGWQVHYFFIPFVCYLLLSVGYWNQFVSVPKVIPLSCFLCTTNFTNLYHLFRIRTFIEIYRRRFFSWQSTRSKASINKWDSYFQKKLTSFIIAMCYRIKLSQPLTKEKKSKF